MEPRIRRFEKEKKIVPTIQINDAYEDMPISSDITLTIPKNYPFRPPLLKIKGMFYITYLERGFRVFKPFIEHYKINTHYNCCLCCSSVSGDNWTPCFGLKEVVQEYKKYSSILNTICIAKLVLINLNMDDLIHSTILSFLL